MWSRLLDWRPSEGAGGHRRSFDGGLRRLAGCSPLARSDLRAPHPVRHPRVADADEPRARPVQGMAEAAMQAGNSSPASVMIPKLLGAETREQRPEKSKPCCVR